MRDHSVRSTAGKGFYRLLGNSKLVRGFPNVSEAYSVVSVDDAGRHTLDFQTLRLFTVSIIYSMALLAL